MAEDKFLKGVELKSGLLGVGIALALITTLFLLIMYFWGFPPFSIGYVFIALMVGFTFIFFLRRKRVTYRTRLMSSAISLSLAGYCTAAAVLSLISIQSGIGLISLVYLLLAYRLVSTDLRLWRWFREGSPKTSG